MRMSPGLTTIRDRMTLREVKIWCNLSTLTVLINFVWGLIAFCGAYKDLLAHYTLNKLQLNKSRPALERSRIIVGPGGVYMQL